MKVVRAVMIEGRAVFDAGAPDAAVAALGSGELIVFPTDTLYGLGADPFNSDAVQRLFAAKRRPEGAAVSVVVPDIDAAKRLAVVSPRAEAMCRRWLPGALTLLFRPTKEAPPSVVSPKNTVAIRVPNHAVALFLAKQFGPITATSANVHGQTAPVEVQTAQEQLGERVAVYIDAGPCPVGRESTVVDLTGAEPRIIREGAVSAERLGIVRRRR